jgi:hypothetical protein
MNSGLIARYQIGGDIYYSLTQRFGEAIAAQAAAHARNEDSAAITALLTRAKHGAPLNDSTADAFVDQIITDPFNAPAAGLNAQIGRLFANLFSNPWLLAAAALALFLALGGGDFLRRKLASQ